MHVKQLLAPGSMIGTRVATLNGTLLNDGGEVCDVRFQYGTTIAYGTDTIWQPGKVAGNTFSQLITGLIPHTTYHFRAQARNGGGIGSGADETFNTH